jgi:predicted nucleic acid-binding protein
MNLFLDTNIILDFLADREPFADDAAKLFNLAERGTITICIAAVSYNNIYYILRQSLKHAETIKVLEELADMSQIIEVNETVIQKALRSDFKDFEDAIQYHCSLLVPKLNAIVTRNGKDFKTSKIPVLSPKEVLTIVKSKD